MHALVMRRGFAPLQLELPFEDFLASGVMRRQAQVAMCSPDDLVYDHLPTFDWDDEEIREAFAEACEQASENAVSKVKLDNDDLLFVRRHFLGRERMRLIEFDHLPAA